MISNRKSDFKELFEKSVRTLSTYNRKKNILL